MMAGGRLRAAGYEFLRFGMKEAWASLFAAIMLALLIATHYWYPQGAALARYDFLFLAALAVQAGLLIFRLETFEEAKVILAYHVVGTVMEIFKTSMGSWIYPEPSFFRIAGVPLFTGFMYSCVGSYLCRAWKLFHLRFTGQPPLWALGLLSLASYANFFTHHYIVDVRVALFAAAAVLFWRTRIYFVVWRTERWMPPVAGVRLHRRLHLACGKHRHLHANLALPGSTGRLVPRRPAEARLVVPPRHHQLHAHRADQAARVPGELEKTLRIDVDLHPEVPARARRRRQPVAQECLDVGVARRLDQQPEPVPAADHRQRRLRRPQHLDRFGPRLGPPEGRPHSPASRPGRCRR